MNNDNLGTGRVYCEVRCGLHLALEGGEVLVVMFGVSTLCLVAVHNCRRQKPDVCNYCWPNYKV